MKVDALGVQAFIAIVDHGSFQRAANELQITQPAISRRMRILERHLGVKLFERTTRPAVLSAAGNRLLPQAKRLMNELSNVLVDILESGKARRGAVCIASVPSAGVQFLPRIFRMYSDAFPDNEITVLELSSAAVVDALLRCEAELGISVAQAHPDLTSTRLLTDQFVLLCRDDHALANEKTLTWKQLAKYPLTLAGETNTNRKVITQALGNSKVKRQRLYEVQGISTALGSVAEGVAVAIAPRLALQKDAYPRLRAVALIDPIISRPLVLLTRKGAHLSPPARALYELMRRRPTV